MTAYRHNKWSQLTGAYVEVRQNYEAFRAGFVDDVMPDSSALWLAADPTHGRVLIEASEGYTVWVEPRELEGKNSYRMTAAALRQQPGWREWAG
ncbi:hypothetical protein M1D88_17815 [Arthrobacter sp. R1-13]